MSWDIYQGSRVVKKGKVMARMQRYVSDELTHFVGRQSTSTDDEKYGLLLKILRSGWLTHIPHDESDTTKRLNVEFANKFSQNTLINTRSGEVPPLATIYYTTQYDRINEDFREFATWGCRPVRRPV